MNSLRSSSHLLLGLPTCLLVLMLVSRPGCQLKTLQAHLFSGREMILRAIRHFCLLCVSIQQVIFCFSMYSLASLVLFLMYSIQSFSFSAASISSSASSWKDTSLSWSFFEFCSEHSSVSLSVVSSSSSSFTFSVPSSFLFVVTFFGSYFRFVCTIRRSIFRCAVLIIFSCFSVNVHVPLAYVIVGVITMLKRRSLWQRR